MGFQSSIKMKGHQAMKKSKIQTSQKQQDVWQFHIGKGKHTTKVCVHLDLAEEPAQDEIVKNLVDYVTAMEDICKTCA